MHTYKMKKFLYILSGIGLMTMSCNKGNDNTSNKPVAKFSISGYEHPTPCTITFINVSSNSTSYMWDFGDGTTSTASNPTHTYNLNGTYILRLTATGPEGTSEACKLVSIEPPPGSQSAFSYYIEKCTGTPVGIAFKTINPLSTNVVWNFGSGPNNLERDPIIQILLPGDYTIKHSSQINGVRDTVTRIIRID